MRTDRVVRRRGGGRRDRMGVSVLLALLLGIGVAAFLPPAPSQAEEGPAATVTTVTVVADGARIGDTVTVRARVTALGSAVGVGRVTFDVAATEAQLFGADAYLDPYPEPSNVTVGSVAVDQNGEAAWVLPLTNATLPFLTAGARFFVAAEYQPFDGQQVYDGVYRASHSVGVGVVAQARPAQETSMLLSIPADVVAGEETPLVASLTPVSASGLVRFTVAGATVGDPVPVEGGSARLAYTFAAGGQFEVAAVFEPADLTSYAPSTAPIRSVTVRVLPEPAIEVRAEAVPSFWLRGPEVSLGAVPRRDVLLFPAGMEIARFTLSSARVPGATTGRYRLTYDDNEYGALTLDQVTWHVMTGAAGDHHVTVTFTPEGATVPVLARTFTVRVASSVGASTTTLTPTPYLAKDGSRRVRLAARATTAGGRAAVGRVGFGSAWAPLASPVRLVNGVAQLDLDASEVIKLGPLFKVTSVWVYFLADQPFVTGVSYAEAELSGLTWATPEQAAMGPAVGSVTVTSAGSNCQGGNTTTTIQTGAAGVSAVAATVTTAAGSCPAGRTVARRDRPTPRTTTVRCQPTTSGYTCPLGVLAANTSFRLSGRFGLPASKAGKTLAVRATTSSADPQTGRNTVLATSTVRVAVPKRTVLKVALTPTVKRQTSLGRGKRTTLKVAVQNLGALGATKVRACVTVSPGAAIMTAKGAKVRGRKACWTLAKVKPGGTVRKKVVVKAPRKKGMLRVGVTVTPKAAQASRVSLTGVLAVT